jgi:chromosome segregation ATPase
VSALTVERDANKRNYDKASSQLEELRTKATAELQRVKDESKRDIENLNIKLNEASENLKNCNPKEISDIKFKVSALTIERDTNKRNYEKASSQLEELRTKATAELQKARTENSQAISSLSNKLKDSEKEVNSLKLQLTNCNNPSDMTSLKSRIDSANSAIQNRQEGIDRLRAEKAELEKQKNIQINAIKLEKEALKSDLQKCRSSKGTDTEDIKSYVLETERLKGELRAVNRELNELKASSSRASSPVSSVYQDYPVAPKYRKRFESLDPFYEKYMKYKQKYLQLRAGNNFA